MPKDKNNPKIRIPDYKGQDENRFPDKYSRTEGKRVDWRTLAEEPFLQIKEDLELPSDKLTKLNSARIAGLAAGQTAQVPPAQFTTGLEYIADKFAILSQYSILSEIRSMKEIIIREPLGEHYRLRMPEVVTPNEYWFAYRGGYVEGLTSFMRADGSQRMPLPESLVTAVNIAINTLAGANSYRRGAALETPGITREAPRRIPNITSLIINEDEETIRDRTKQIIEDQRQRGYQVGFAVAIARDYGVVLTEAEIPSDTPSYREFMRGLKPEAVGAEVSLDIALAQLDLRKIRYEKESPRFISNFIKPETQEKKPDRSYRDFESDYSQFVSFFCGKLSVDFMAEVYKATDDACYKAGLRVAAKK